MNHEPGPSTTQSASRDRAPAPPGRPAGRSGRGCTRDAPARRSWPPRPGRGPWSTRVGVGRVQAPHLGGDVQRRDRHRQHPALGAEQPADPVEAVDVVAEQLPQRDDQQVADRVAVHLALAGEPVLEHPRPGLAPLVVAAQRGQRHPQVAGRQHAELAAQPARRAAVVGDGDDRGQVVDDAGAAPTAVAARPCPPPRATTERLGARPAHVGVLTPVPGRGGSASGLDAPRRGSRAAISSVIATLRCLPPVQPIATVMNRLPSRR